MLSSKHLGEEAYIIEYDMYHIVLLIYLINNDLILKMQHHLHCGKIFNISFYKYVLIN